MDQNNTLHKLLEAADLAKMVEELIAPGNIERLSPASLSGVRVTLRSLRETMLSCHDLMAGDLVARARGRFDNANSQPIPSSVDAAQNAQSRAESPAIVRPPAGAEQPRMIKKDLRSSLSQMVERSVTNQNGI